MTEETKKPEDANASEDKAATLRAAAEQAAIDEAAELAVLTYAEKAQAAAFAASQTHPDPEPDPEADRKGRLNVVLVQVETGNHEGGLPALVKKLAKAKDTTISDKDGLISVEMAGVTVSSNGGMGRALADWCMKARTTIMQLS